MDKFPIVFAMKHCSDEIRLKSRSGGFFTAISDYILENNGSVYGCILDEKFNAIHARALDEYSRNKMRGSKYIQSHKGNIYARVKQDLTNGMQVLFTGTSCEIKGLKLFLGRDYNNLICMDIVCHGVPSKLVLSKYIEWAENKYSSKLLNFDFRNKREFGWRENIETLSFKNGRKINSVIYSRLFYSNYILRPSCYHCPFKSIQHPGDISVADYWGIENNAPEMDDNQGVSLVLVNNIKGKIIFDKIKENILYKETSIQNSMQKAFVSSYSEPVDRNEFWNIFYTNDFNKVIKKYCFKSYFKLIKVKLRIIIRKNRHSRKG